ncbi:thioredoxin domain-containing protein [Pseudoflavitalea sp. G-6-1-2]|uniref:thioredoxin domain-containing protein n=1 Tax=Pseudoflavitalea sp. G-6-1-2 TaxID=2728841 RepID=UPI003211F12E
MQTSTQFLLISILLFMVPAAVWFSIKPVIKKLQEHVTTKRDYLRIKFNNQVFYNLLRKEKQIIEEPEGLGIDIGNPDAKFTLIKICNPYCGPCAEAHPRLEKVLEEVPQLKLKIIFVAPNNPRNLAFQVVRHFMAIANEYTPEQTKLALRSWYTDDKKEYEKFAATWPVREDLNKPSTSIEAMYSWCRKNNTNYTPSYYLNGHQLPAAYSIADLQYFLSE